MKSNEEDFNFKEFLLEDFLELFPPGKDPVTMEAALPYSPEVSQLLELEDWAWITKTELLRDEGNVAGRVDAPHKHQTRTIFLHFWSQAEMARMKKASIESEIAGLKAEQRYKTDQLRKLEGDYQNLGGEGSNKYPFFIVQSIYSLLISSNILLIAGLALGIGLGMPLLHAIGLVNPGTSSSATYSTAIQLVILAIFIGTLVFLMKSYLKRLGMTPYLPYLRKKEKMLKTRIKTLQEDLSAIGGLIAQKRSEHAQHTTQDWYLAQAFQHIHQYLSEHELASHIEKRKKATTPEQAEKDKI